jgi:hypothetical protein
MWTTREAGELTEPIIVDISEYLKENVDTIPLEPGCLVRFHQHNSTLGQSLYTLSYKQKIGG